MEIFSASAVHYQGIAGVFNSIYPEYPYTSSEIEAADRNRDPKYKHHRWVAVENDRVIGVATYNQNNWFDHPQKFLVWVGVLPERRECGTGSLLFEALMQGLEPFDPIALRASIGNISPEGIRFLEKRGFREIIRDIRSELDVQSVDLSRITHPEDRFRAAGIEIKTLAELEEDPDRNQKLYDLDWELSLSVPGDLAAGIGRRGLDQYVEYAVQGPNTLPEGFFVAVKEDEYVGLSHVLTIEKGVSLYHGLTGVKVSYRNLGIGQALKFRVIAYAQTTGHKKIVTDNDAKNIPMLIMNEKLGYVPTQESITYEKQITNQ